MTQTKNGKAVITVKNDQTVFEPCPITNEKTDRVAAITSKGRLLIFPLNQLPYLKKGKGNKIISIPQKMRSGKNPERLKFLKILPLHFNLVIHSGRHELKLTPGNQKDYRGMRGRRGKKLPQTFQNVDSVLAIPVKTENDPELE